MELKQRNSLIIRKRKSELAIQDILLTVAAYGLYVCLVTGKISPWIFGVFIFIYTFRSFNIRHEKSHTPPSSGLKPTWLDNFSDYFQIYYLPYHEPYLGKRWKHIAHHRFHLNEIQRSQSSTKEDPHRVFEQGSPIRAFLMALLYEEVNLYFDLRDRGFSRDRRLMLAISLPLIFAMIHFGGMRNFLVLAVAYRLSLAVAWFTFSYVMHVPAIYKSRLGDYLPTFSMRICDFILGHGMSTAVFYHSSHHSKPQGYVQYG